MSEPIQSIYNNNYLLSNLDAQKLYAQSPLTTGVSGTSAYIGIEPSARYNETVLWSGSPTSAITASESFKNFERVGIYFYMLNQPDQVYFFDMNNMGSTGYFNVCRPRGQINVNVGFINITATETSLGVNASKMVSFGSYSTTANTVTCTVNASEEFNSIHKVVGINRKEV